jgi:hypothetical protein
MENIKDLLSQKRESKKSPKYRFQEICLEIIKLLSLDDKDKGLVWRLWRIGGYPLIGRILGEAKEKPIYHPDRYLKYIIKNYK